MTKFFRSLFVPLIVIAVLVWLAFGKTSIPSFFGAIVPLVLLVAFWVVLSRQRKSQHARRDSEQLQRNVGTTDAEAKRIGLDG